MDLFDIADTQLMSREEAAAKLRALADALAKNNSVEFQREQWTITVRRTRPDSVRHTDERRITATRTRRVT